MIESIIYAVLKGPFKKRACQTALQQVCGTCSAGPAHDVQYIYATVHVFARVKCSEA